LSALNHFTVPVAISQFHLLAKLMNGKKAQTGTIQTRSIRLQL
jgi:hypothetical protein